MSRGVGLFSMSSDQYVAYAENGGEYYVEDAGCWVDGYCDDTNIVIEVYEPYHYPDGTLRKKDIRRELDIIKTLNPNAFIRIKVDASSNIISKKDIIE